MPGHSVDPADRPCRIPRDQPGINVGDVLKFTPQVGGNTLPATSLTVSATTTLGDLTSLMNGALGIQSGNGIPNDPNEVGGPGQPGVDVVNGQIQITGDMGTDNDITFAAGDCRITERRCRSASTRMRRPMAKVPPRISWSTIRWVLRSGHDDRRPPIKAAAPRPFVISSTARTTTAQARPWVRARSRSAAPDR